MKSIFTLFVCCASLMAKASSSVSDVTLSYDALNGIVTVNYEFSGDPAIVTVDFKSHGISIGDGQFTTVMGDVNRLVEGTGTKRIVWPAAVESPGIEVEAGKLTAEVKVWDRSTPPDYLVVDLKAVGECRYYVSTNAIPDGGLANLKYRRDYLVMRRIPAKGVTFRMGSPTSEANRTSAETTHYTSFDHDYWMSIYLLTSGAYDLARTDCIMDAAPPTYAQMKPVNKSYESMRGKPTDNPAIDWPTTKRDKVGGSLASMRTRLGIDVDLPTEAEWEFACRAGTSGVRNGGGYWSWSKAHGSWISQKDGIQPVGYLAPNAWGLYDMLGNVNEWCLDWFATSVDSWSSDAEHPELNPEGPKDGELRVRRGGCVDSDVDSRSAYRQGWEPDGGQASRGYVNGYTRLVAPIELTYPAAVE